MPGKDGKIGKAREPGRWTRARTPSKVTGLTNLTVLTSFFR
jgi:hypothetical protein